MNNLEKRLQEHKEWKSKKPYKKETIKLTGKRSGGYDYSVTIDYEAERLIFMQKFNDIETCIYMPIDVVSSLYKVLKPLCEG